MSEVLSPAERLRYSRHLSLREIGVAGQQRLKAARVGLIGAGGIGSPAALYLAAAGVGTVGLVDFDVVDESNLQRQVLYDSTHIGMAKTTVARARLEALNPAIRIVAHQIELCAANIEQLFAHYDLIIDGSDRIGTRYLVNDACVLYGKPLVSAAIHRFEGQVMSFVPQRGPCYRCLFAHPAEGLVPNCADVGVLGVLPGVLGTIAATEAIKLIVGIGQPAIGKFVIYNSLDMNFRTLKLHKDPACPICGENRSIHQLIDYEQFCGMKVMETQTQEVKTDGKSEITALELKVKRDEKQNFLLLDVREPNEYEIAHIEGSTLLPLSQLPGRFHELDQFKGKEIVVHCKSGVRSKKAIDFLKQQGFTRLVNVAGGILGWSDQVDSSVPKY